METLENKIAQYLFDGGYETWNLMYEYESGIEEPCYISTKEGDRLLAEVRTDGRTLTCTTFLSRESFRPTEAQVKTIQDYLYGLTGDPELR